MVLQSRLGGMGLAGVLAMLAGSSAPPTAVPCDNTPACHAEAPPATIARFDRGRSPIGLVGPARPVRYMEASGRRAAFLGREDGSFEAWVYPLKVLHDFSLAFGVAAYADPIPASSLASTVDIRPESSTVRYSHASFTADATWLVPIDERGGLVLLDLHTSEPVTVSVRFRIDLKPMWPAALGGQYSYWDDALKAFVVGEGSRKHAALIGSPLGLAPPPQPAHNLPDAPSQFTIRITPEVAAQGLVPIVITASTEGLEAARQSYARLLTSVESLYRDTAAHYARLRDTLLSVDTPDDRIDLAFEWGKVALDKGFVCNPHLGCGLIAGLGPSGTTERPGFGWYFGGDAFINSWAMTAYGDFETVRQSLDFLRARQRADGKMMHELSQGAGYIRWFEDYPYGYYHADTTPLFIVAVRDYVDASGDFELARTFWPAIRKAYDYCLSTDEDGDGLMDNTRAGLAAVETGALRSRDVLTDVFLAAAWTEAAAATAWLARAAEPSFAAIAEAAATKARTSLNRRFLDEPRQRVFFAIMKTGVGQAEQTVWPAFGIWRGVFDLASPAVVGMLDELARAGIATDWGARMLSRESRLYEPLSYNNGAVWPFLSGFAALALYAAGRAPAAWAYLDGTADLTFLESRGYVPELLSGDRLRSIDAAVPHQLFATTGFVSPLLRGLIGLGTMSSGGLRIAPQMPPAWRFLRVRNLRWRDARLDVEVTRESDRCLVRLVPRAGRVPLTFELTLPPGAELLPGSKPGRFVLAGREADRGLRLIRSGDLMAAETLTVAFRPGIVLELSHPPLALGDAPARLRFIDERLVAGTYTARLQGRRGETYRVVLDIPFAVLSLTGAREVARNGSRYTLEITCPDGAEEWQDVTLAVRIGTRLKIRGGDRRDAAGGVQSSASPTAGGTRR